MRIRSVRPSFWSDSHISDLAEPTRLFYIGLWMIADDAGWIRWDTREAALELYGYEGVRRREARVERMLAELATAGRVVVHDCGHVEIPTLPTHQHLAGWQKRVNTAFNEHLRKCVETKSPQIPADARNLPQIPASGREGKSLGKDREGKGSFVRESEFQLKVERPS